MDGGESGARHAGRGGAALLFRLFDLTHYRIDATRQHIRARQVVTHDSPHVRRESPAERVNPATERRRSGAT
jgi:hypothetical protein